MRNIILLLLLFTVGCTKEPLTSVSVEMESNATNATEPFMQKTVLWKDAYYKDSALVQLPVGYNSTTSKFPVLIFFHGTGEAVNDGGLKVLTKLGPPKYMADSVRLAGGLITVCPQDYDGYRSADNVNQIINAVIKKYRVDTNRIYLTGLSAGARNIMTYITGSTNYAKRIAAVVPMSIIYMDQTSMSRMQNFATYNVHTKIYVGNQDYSYYKTNVQCRDKINYYKAGLCEFVEYVGAHNGWNKLYNPGRRGMNNVYNWLMQWRN